MFLSYLSLKAAKLKKEMDQQEELLWLCVGCGDSLSLTGTLLCDCSKELNTK